MPSRIESPVRPAAFTNGVSSPDSSLLPKSPFEYPVLNGLPPTPPSNSREDRTSNDRHAHTNGISTALLSKTSAATTPLSQRSPPTPDISPPGSLNALPKKNLSPLSSSRTGSFRTAREEPWYSDEEDSLADDTVVEVAQGSGVPDYGLGLAGFETEDDDITPTQSRLIISKGLKEIIPDEVSNTLDYIPNREWDTNMMRNVTVRRKRPQPPKAVKTDIEPLTGSRDLKRSPRAVELKAQHSPHTPSTTSSPKDPGWSPLRQNMTSHLRSSSDPKRVSTLSTSSTIVEAVVIATPPQRQRTLRHVSKKVILRDSSSSSESSPTSSVNAATFSPNDAPQRILQHKQMVARTSAIRRKSSSPAVPLKHHRESASLRSDAAKSAKRPRDSKLQSTNGESLHFDPIRDLQPSEPTKSTGKQSTIRSAVDQRVSEAVSPRVKFTDSTNALVDQRELYEPSATSLTRSATHKALKAVIPMASVDKAEKRADSMDELPTTEPTPTAINHSMPVEDTTRKTSVVRSHSGSSSLSPLKPFPAPRLSLDDSATEDIRRYSFDRSTIGTHEYARNSLDRSNSRIEEHAMARHLYSQVTPFSQISDVPSALEVSEATAVNIYPHNNHSLLVVQHGNAIARPTQTKLIRHNTTGSAASATSAKSALSELEPPLLTVQPSTPPPKEKPNPQNQVDSPLKNPRPPPEPPAIKILPATPFEELDSSPMDAAAQNQLPLTRRSTLAQRARRYSDNLFQPLIARTQSLRRGVDSVRRATGSSAAASIDQKGGREQQEDGKLHPFWHPRGFWEDVSDSDSEFGGGEYHEPWEEEVGERLPPGGDTSEVPEPRRGVLDGVRGSGGFMIGNSLGLERGPTNRKRHFVDPGRMARANGALAPSADGRVAKKSSQGSLGRLMVEEGRKRRVWKGMGLHVEYLGVAGLREMMRERKAERRREKLKRSIGEGWTVEGGAQV